MATPSSSRSSSSEPDVPPVQPDHFYPGPWSNVAKSPSPDGDQDFLSPDQDPLATRGIPVFKPSMQEFQDFEAYMEKVDVWGKCSGIVKIIPPKEWSDALPSTRPLLPTIKVKNPIEQVISGQTGVFQQRNVETRRTMSVRQWSEYCARDDVKAPSLKAVKDTDGDGIRTRTRGAGTRAASNKQSKPTRRRRRKDEVDTNEVNESEVASEGPAQPIIRHTVTDSEFYDSFEPKRSWLPEDTEPTDYTPEACHELASLFWREVAFRRPFAMYGADMEGSLFTPATTTFNVAHLPSFLSRLRLNKPLPGVNTPYLYFGMWRATFAWHVEDMDLYSINYIHWGAPKYWYAIPNERAGAFERIMQSSFLDSKKCPQFLRHKSYLASPSHLANSACRPNVLVQHQGEFVITYPRGYHAGFNLGLNCAESVNFALESWVELARKAKVCECVGDSVVIDIDALIAESNANQMNERILELDKTVTSRKRKVSPHQEVPQHNDTITASHKRQKKSTDLLAEFAFDAKPPNPNHATKPKVPKPTVAMPPCCLCASTSSTSSLLRVHQSALPLLWRPAIQFLDNGINRTVQAHEICANVVPETWVDTVPVQSGTEKMVFGVDCIPKDRWNLKCSSCSNSNLKLHGSKIQCTKTKCTRAFHVTCAIADVDVVYRELDVVEKEVLSLDLDSDHANIRDANRAKMVNHLETPDASPVGPSLEQPSASSTHKRKVLSKVRKTMVEVLCSQHNPILAQARKDQKHIQFTKELLALPSMSRIRVRMSGGVFEVSLVKVVESRGTIEVVWDSGTGNPVNRELRWGSVVWGPQEGFRAPYKTNALAKPREAADMHPNLASQPAVSAFNPTPVSSLSQPTAGHITASGGPTTQPLRYAPGYGVPGRSSYNPIIPLATPQPSMHHQSYYQTFHYSHPYRANGQPGYSSYASTSASNTIAKIPPPDPNSGMGILHQYYSQPGYRHDPPSHPPQLVPYSERAKEPFGNSRSTYVPPTQPPPPDLYTQPPPYQTFVPQPSHPNMYPPPPSLSQSGSLLPGRYSWER